MPVYIRKNVSYTPPSIYNMQLEDDNDFLLDPDQLRDILPQPYRMINKLLDHMLDDVWEICETKENAILAEARKVRPPRLEEPTELEVYILILIFNTLYNFIALQCHFCAINFPLLLVI